MTVEKINIRRISDGEYRKIAERQSPELLKRLENCGDDEKKRTLAGRYLLEKTIKQIYGKERFQIVYNSNGKPLCDFCFFSISHSGDYAAVAVSDKPIGIDIQMPDGYKKRAKYMLFSCEENEFVNNGDSENRFYTLWTMKESYVKAVGGTLSSAAKISLAAGGRLNMRLGNYIFKTEKADGYFISVCFEE